MSFGLTGNVGSTLRGTINVDSKAMLPAGFCGRRVEVMAVLGFGSYSGGGPMEMGEGYPWNLEEQTASTTEECEVLSYPLPPVLEDSILGKAPVLHSPKEPHLVLCQQGYSEVAGWPRYLGLKKYRNIFDAHLTYLVF